MHFRQLTCTSVLLACAIAVFAAPAPIAERDYDNEIEARGWDAHMIPRYGGNDLISEAVCLTISWVLRTVH